jgi:uncharacterized membrane protein
MILAKRVSGSEKGLAKEVYLTSELSSRVCSFMPDEVPTQPQPPPGPEPGTTAKSTSTGLPSNVAAAIACIPLAGGIIFYILEKHDNFVRFYAMQSIILGGAWFLFYIVAMVVSLIFHGVPVIAGVLEFFWGLVATLIYIAFLVVWIIATVKAFTGVRWEIPYIGPMARKQMGEV